jgi:flagellar biosynthesis protein FlhF
MRQYAELIGIPLLVASSPTELANAARKLDGCDKIFVDTAGRSPRDTTAIRELLRALSTLSGIEFHLTMAASTSASAMDTIFARYRAAGVARLLLTKIDEADALGELVRAPARLATPVAYITTGQAVPEDLHPATPQVLLHLATQGRAREAA